MVAKSSSPRANEPATLINSIAPSLALAGARIAGVGHYVPDRVVDNAHFVSMLDTSDEWIVTRTGIRERRYAAEDQASSDLATAAARRALEDARLVPSELDCVIVATCTPDFRFPATACLVAAKLGAGNVPGFDLEIACSGFVYALPVAAGLVRSRLFRRILVVGVETLSRITNFSDRTTCVLFGDGAGAVILEQTTLERDGYLGSRLGTDGTRPELLYIPAGGSRTTLTPERIAADEDKIRMNGREIFRYAVTRMVETAQGVLADAGLTADDVALMIPHQANARIIEAAAKRLEFEPERVVCNVDRYGNTSAASIPIALSEAVAAGRVRPGDILLFTGFGGGLSWGSIAWKWTA